VRSDLAPIVHKLFMSQGVTGKLDGIVVETTGLALPGPVMQTFLTDSPSMLTRLDTVVTVVDASNVGRHFARVREAVPEVDKNGAGSVDLLAFVRSSFKDTLRAGPNECIEQIAFADLVLLNKCDLVGEERLAEIEAELRAINPYARQLRCTNTEVPMEELLNTRSFELDHVLDIFPPGNEHGNGHGSGIHGHSHEHTNDRGNSCVHEARHESSVTSISIQHTGRVDLHLMEKWFGQLLRLQGDQIYRMKGVLAVAGDDGSLDQKLAYHGVHSLFRGDLMGTYSEGERRENRLVFIGQGLDGEILRTGFLDCTID